MTGPRFVLTLIAVITATAIIVASSGTPPTGRTGAPGANNCTGCHSSFALNSGVASFAVTAPATVSPGQTIPVTVRFNGTVGTRFGFSMTARDAANTFLGTWAITDAAATQILSGAQEVGQLTASTQKTWTVNWTAPASLTTTAVTFYACGVDGNGSGSSGDYVYTASTTVSALRLNLTVTSTAQSYTMSLSGGAALAGQEYQVLATTNSVPGPFIGLMPDALFWALFTFPNGFPGVHAALDAAGNASVSYPGALAGLAGVPLRFAAFTRNSLQNITGISNVSRVTP